MAWVAEETFEGYSDGALASNNGGSGWSVAWASAVPNWAVQGTTVYQGSKAISYTAASGGASSSRTITTDLTGDGNILYVAVRAAQTNGGGFRFNTRNTSDQASVYIQFDAVDGFGSTGNIYLFGRATDGGSLGVVTIVSGYSANTWYVIRITVNVTSKTFTAAYSTDAYGTAGTFSSESSPRFFVNNGNQRYVRFDVENTSADYFLDYISPTSPFTATTIKSYNGILTANVKTVYNSTAIASRKTWNGIT